MNENIRVADDTYAALRALKGDDETFDDLLSRLVEERRETIRNVAGRWDGSDAVEKAEAARSEMKRDVGDR